ncbi:hypothetical protein [Clostridium lacusfryxellense]|uniref:hypothetical protein n=1 Tax=Clostridium lacusfryxellense TaxID=205328 RepID=UPI001C0AED84|nr:hypothetical protein [Clostridium lacusfryxellense]MBU3113594.1 hypothetical protein [Clostridium lacusfryxellense]
MEIPDELLIDAEKTNNVAGHPVMTVEGKGIAYIISGKIIVAVSDNERTNKIYKLLEENCDVIFCTTCKMGDFPFYPVPTLTIFAYDSKGNCFGTIGGMDDIECDDYPVGYINKEGMNGRISSDLKEFLELVTFYPYWSDIIKYEQMGVAYDINDMDTKHREDIPQYFAHQREIAETLKLSKNLQSIELLISNIRSSPGFVIYSSISEAKKTNIFLEDYILDFIEDKE